MEQPKTVALAPLLSTPGLIALDAKRAGSARESTVM